MYELTESIEGCCATGDLAYMVAKGALVRTGERRYDRHIELLPVSRTPGLGVLMRTESANGTTII